jgi:hypothetical protein
MTAPACGPRRRIPRTQATEDVIELRIKLAVAEEKIRGLEVRLADRDAEIERLRSEPAGATPVFVPNGAPPPPGFEVLAPAALAIAESDEGYDADGRALLAESTQRKAPEISWLGGAGKSRVFLPEPTEAPAVVEVPATEPTSTTEA